ncbi:MULTISPECIES: fimbria/pilus chaperone family protein [Enterobacter cloacae complex]|uniref:Fimbria/pilus periplasmic chaperone n=2 Tax=Enterobacter cloacae complex TaxID=354276 RepID=A0A7H8UCE1_ENTCL|nr:MULTISPECIES: fimbria/pilus chaperone family protein [Enterobacter cloacae complex]MCM7512810.1 fimbria/pilus chaperone family protein [Enterobacter hormaechei]MBE4855183.1 fimbria/pilus periplasmic chaperone [Enterobacter pasteurii]MBE4865035.1 fimbria/pilus periplasmic chaperone [Enterobacter cloacae complex sp. P40C2]MBE4877211.1 fimbria/pilus periplasmic chaperone [Enterobacter cloacae complex sp. P40C]MCY0772776.1 fimbria/pilus chaperone family protein [Enterobacter cloacae complex sp.
MTCSKNVLFKTLAVAALFTAQFAAHAAGMVPETSLLVIDEATHSGTINVKNTDSHPSLLYTDVVDLPDDKGLKLVTTQPVVRLEPGQTQQLRFILQTSKPLDVEHYKRVTFEGIPPKSDDNKVKIGINIRQDLPVLIRPAKLAVVTDAWKFLDWTASGTSVTVKNPSKYVVRLAQNVVLQPSGISGVLAKTYILPGETMTVSMGKSVSGNNKVKFFPASRYGVEVPSFIADLNK